MMRIMGIDPGLRRMGWAVITVDGNRHSSVSSGVCRSETGQPLADRLCLLHEQLSHVLARETPDEVAVEETFVNKDAVATLKLGHARAIALFAPRAIGLPVAEYAPNRIKKTVVGAGHADKTQVEYMVRLQIKGANPASADIADAYAIALCHAHLRTALRGVA